jgi:GTP cyclohydrolase I
MSHVQMPDITSSSEADDPSSLQWVGMESIAVPLRVNSKLGSFPTVAATADVYVSLDAAKAKGIHMSRMYAILNKLADIECKQETMEQLLDDMVQSQSGISGSAKISLAFGMLLKKPALISDQFGFQTYPVGIHSKKTGGGFVHEFEFTITYSSTCPCSASLARQLYAREIEQKFSETRVSKVDLLDWAQSETGSVATPHSQRSYAYIRLSLVDGSWPNLPHLIEQIETALGTPVQTAVKRNDEQEFARLNATNLMFCEDAARRIKYHLDQKDSVQNYRFKIEHQESLHAHNAVVIHNKNSDLN